MQQNKTLRKAVASHLQATIPDGMVKRIFDTWLLIDGDGDTPAVMVYIDNGEPDDEYADATNSDSGVLSISIILGISTTDDDLDDIGEEIKKAIPLGFRIPGVGRLRRSGFQYERSVEHSYRALHLNHQYKVE